MAVTYHFILRADKKRSDGKAPIYLRITENRQSRQLSTGQWLKPTHWHKGKEHVRRSHSTYKAMNSILSDMADAAKKIQADLSKHNKSSAKAIQRRLKKHQSSDFFDIADVYLQKVKREQSHYTHKNSKVAIDKMEAFVGKRSLPIKNLTTAKLEAFEAFLRDEYDNAPNTIHKNFRPIKAVIQRALKDHLIGIDPLANFEGAKKAKAKPKTKLSFKQIKAMQDITLERGSKMWHVRNYFMFSFYSGGIRFGDICCLRWSDIRDGELSYQMNKNDKVFTIELNGYQEAILDEYAITKQPNGYIFPILNPHRDLSDETELRKRIGVHNTIVNKSLKRLAKRLNKKIKKDKLAVPPIDSVSFHVSRHSFAQYAVSEKNLSVYELRQALRHSSLETTEQYLKGLDKDLANKAMKKVF